MHKAKEAKGAKVNYAVDADFEFKFRVLKNTRLFQDAPEKEISLLARSAKIVSIPRGAGVPRQGQDGQNLHVVQSGVGAELHLEYGEERPILVKMHGPGDIAGLVSAIMRDAIRRGLDARKATERKIEAVTNITALSLPAADVLQMCRRNSKMGETLTLLLAEQHEILAGVYARSTYNTLETRLARFFSRLSELIAPNEWRPETNVGKLSQSAIATMLGVSREHVNRTLAMWERTGVVFQNNNGEFVIQDSKRLSRLALTDAKRGAPDKVDDWLEEIDAHLDRGLNRTALHLSLETAKRAPKDLRYWHRAALTSAQYGAYSEALNLIDKWNLSENDNNEDFACLRPRILRDLAYSRGQNSPDMLLLRHSAEMYEKVFRVSRGFYSGVNAAAGYVLIGDAEKSRELIAAVSDIIGVYSEEEENSYWRRTTLAEYRLIQGDLAAAASLFGMASASSEATPGKIATTRRQLRRLAVKTGIDEAWIDMVAPQPSVMFFSGPLANVATTQHALQYKNILHRLDHFLKTRSVAWAYGALVSGADIIIAEALLRKGIELNIHLPLPPDEFLDSSVNISGSNWRERFIACLRAAASVEWARRTRTPSNSAFRLGALVAMGKAVQCAAHLETETIGFFAVQPDDQNPCSLSNINRDIWRRRGLATIETGDDWPAAYGYDDIGTGPENGDVLYFALVIKRSAGDAPFTNALACDHYLELDKDRIEIFLFDSLKTAIDAAASVSTGARAASSSLWLDAGVFDKKDLVAAPETAAAGLITAACRPITESGKVFASQTFAWAAELEPALDARFEYIGYAPTREKLHPCALYRCASSFALSTRPPG